VHFGVVFFQKSPKTAGRQSVNIYETTFKLSTKKTPQPKLMPMRCTTFNESLMKSASAITTTCIKNNTHQTFGYNMQFEMHDT